AWRLRSHCHGDDPPQSAAHRGPRIGGSPRRRRRPPGASARTATAMIPHSRLLIAVPALAARPVAGGGRLAPPLALPRRMIPHSRPLIPVRSSGLAQRADLLAYAALPLLRSEERRVGQES